MLIVNILKVLFVRLRFLFENWKKLKNEKIYIIFFLLPIFEFAAVLTILFFILLTWNFTKGFTRRFFKEYSQTDDHYFRLAFNTHIYSRINV